jgi:XTP/dITP diphosphohydrolase
LQFPEIQKTVVVYTDGKTTKAFSGKTYGVIAMEKGAPNERFNFGYERLFIPDGFSTHMSAFSLEEKNAISHRAKAAKAFKEWFLAQK